MDKLDALSEGIDEDLNLMSAPVGEEEFEYQLFVPYIEGAETVTSSPMIGSIAYSVVLTKLPEGSDVESIAADIEKNMNPRKWICVEAETAWVKTSGQYVLLVMADKEYADIIAANFDMVFAD
ncbi:MAG: hypothetical protein ACOX68_03155 [Candidatus Limivicinus sp.]|jgi:hypothetical protein